MWIFKKPNRQMLLDWRGYLVGPVLVALASLLKLLTQPEIISTPNSLPYMLAIVITAIYFGLGPAIIASILSLLTYDFFFVEPFFGFTLPGMQEIPVLVIFLLVGVIVSLLASNLRHKTEEAIKANEELQLRATILDKATDAILLRDLQNKILYSNDAASDIYGYGKDELVGLNLRSLLAPQEEPYFEERTRSVLENGELRAEVFHFRKDRSVIPLEIHAHLIKIGQKEYILAVIRDITEQKKFRDEKENLTRRLLEAQEEERKRIALELHDDASPSLAYLGLELDAVTTQYSNLPEEIIQRLKKVRENLNSTQQDIRRYSHELHPAILDNLGLVPALETLVEELNSKGRIEVEFDVAGRERRLSNEINLALYRITQEALNNVWTHSQAAKAIVSLEYSPDNVKLSISDNGLGFDSSIQTKSLGLTGMKERANLIGAKLEIESANGRGTTISVEVSA